MTDSSLSPTYDALALGLVAGAPACPVCHESVVRVGTDVQEIAAVAAALRDHDERYLQRVFTSQEIDASTGGTTTTAAGLNASATASLAGRYAVKEATIKALRPVHTGVPWPDIEVVRQPGGWCTLELHGVALRLASTSNLSHWSASFAHDGLVAVATVISLHTCGHVRPS
ncbi:MAG: holo-ACP synthase [Marmoricola sp.]